MALGVCDKGPQCPPNVRMREWFIVLTQVSGDVRRRGKSVDEEIGFSRRNDAIIVGSNNQRSTW